MMIKVIMLVFKTSVCRKVTPTHRVPEHSLLPFLNLASQPTPVPGEDNNENDDKVETIKEASKENTCNIFLHDDVTCIFFFSSTSFQLHFDFKLSELWEATKCSTWTSGGWWGNTMFSFLGEETESIDLFTIHAKNVWCCGEGYFAKKKLRKKCVNRDKM